MNMITILIVDDTARVREELSVILQLTEGMLIVGEAVNGIEALQKTEELNPDVVLMDLEMSRLDGYEATRQIKSKNPQQAVIVQTMHGSEESRRKALEAGADVFLEKGSGSEKLVDAIRQVATGNHGMHQDVPKESVVIEKAAVVE